MASEFPAQRAKSRKPWNRIQTSNYKSHHIRGIRSLRTSRFMLPLGEEMQYKLVLEIGNLVRYPITILSPD